jgi:hypothetical protein
MSSREFSVRCATPALPIEQLVAELMIGGLEEVIVVADGDGGRLTIRGRAPAESQGAARTLVEEQIHAATLDLTILAPGVWVDERIPDP